jgi:hypothetical protein
MLAQKSEYPDYLCRADTSSPVRSRRFHVPGFSSLQATDRSGCTRLQQMVETFAKCLGDRWVSGEVRCIKYVVRESRTKRLPLCFYLPTL